MRFGDYARLVSGAIVELFFGAVLFLVSKMFIDEASRATFIRDTAGDWMAVTGQVLLPASVAIWITYVNIESTNFGDYLRYRRATGAFQLSFIYPCFVFFAATVALIFTKGTRLSFLPSISIFLLMYSAAVFTAMVLNVASVMRLYGAFRIEFEKEKSKDISDGK